MTTKVKREKLAKYLKAADDKKVKAIYTMAEDEIATSENDWDEDFINELEKRSKRAAKGIAKAYSWEETKKDAINKVNSKRK